MMRRGEGLQKYETKRRRKDGTIIDVSMTVSFIYDAAGAVVGGSSITHDITERKRAEETRALLAAVVQSADDAIVSGNLDWSITSWNPGAEKLYGYSAAEVIGRSLDLLVPSARSEETRQLRARLVRGESVQQFETRRVKKDGTLFDASITVSPVYDANGAVVGVSAFTKDITERKRAEESRALLATIVQFADDAIVSTDLTGKIMTWNPGAEKLYGYRADEIVGQTIGLLVPPDRSNEISRFRARIIHGEGVQRYETSRVKKDGALVDISASLSPIYDAGGAIVGTASITRDITERRLAERAKELARSNAESRTSPT